MAFDFSDEQKKSIAAEGSNYLISAGAGSGKTAVLTNRIYRLAKRTGTLDNFLVMTFTNLAAARMKEKVRELLIKDPETRHLASEVDSAHIETFDSFNLFLAKKYFYLLGISKDISIVEKEILGLKRKKILDELFLKKIREKDPDLLEFLEIYAIKSTDDIKGVVLKIINTADTKIDKDEFIKSLTDKYFEDEYLKDVITNFVNESKEDIRRADRLFDDLETPEDVESLHEYCSRLLGCKTYDELYYFAHTENEDDTFPKKTGGKSSDDKYRDKVKKKLLAVLSRFEFPQDELISKIKATQKYVKVAVDLAVSLEAEVDAYKKEHNVFTFSDISRMTYSLLDNKEICDELRNQFDFIMIDEYQDTNDIQESVINRIAKNNIYMVGDIKQSIYRFRNADCTIFNEKWINYKNKKGGKEIDLNKSYRSRKEIVDFINDCFSKIMTKANNPIDYSNGHLFGYGNEKSYDNPPEGTNYKVEEYRYESTKSGDNVKKEIEIVINDIIHKYNEGYLIYDSDDKVYRPCDFKDFCIIMDREGEFEQYMRAFSEAKIPLNIIGKDDIKNCEVFTVIKNLTKMLYLALQENYTHEYRHAFMSVARSFVCEYSDQDIYELVVDKSGSKVLLCPLAHNIELIKEKLRFASLEEVVKTLIDEFKIYEKIPRLSEFYKNTHKVETLISYATQMDLLGMDLEEFVEYFDYLMDANLKIEYRSKDAQSNAVTLINIHQSKGLEYEIIYYTGLFKESNMMEYNDKFFATKDFGVILRYVDSDSDPFLKGLYKRKNTQELNEEKIRVLYVALTRAKQKAIIIRPYAEVEYPVPKTTLEIESLLDVYEMAGLGDKYVAEYPEEKEELVLRQNENKDTPQKATIKKVNIDTTAIKKQRASKSSASKVDEDLLIFGTELHGYLEGVDFNNPDLSRIYNNQMKKYVSNVINAEIFKNLENSQVLHEYSFKDDENNVRGIIDCLIVKDDEIDIVDFKLKNLSEDAYDTQLRTYKKYIATLTDKPIKMYLLAALTGETREVKDE